MVLSISEARERRTAALKALAESTVLSQWYYVLSTTLKEQKEDGANETDFSSHWISGGHSTTYAIKMYYKATDIEGERDTDDLVVKFITDLIGDQLSELGLTPKVVGVVSGMEAARWVFFLKPGQKPVLNPKR